MRSMFLFTVVFGLTACGADTTSMSGVNPDQASVKLNNKEILLVSLGASTTNGVAFDIGQGKYLAANAHIPAFAGFLSQATGSEIDVYNLSVPGQTSSDILATQLESALEEIPRYTKGVVVTLEAGGNDLRAFALTDAGLAYCQPASPAYDQNTCMALLAGVLATAQDNIATMLTALRQVAPTAPVIIMTQYNPYFRTGCAQGGFEWVAQAALETEGFGLNTRLRALAAAFDAQVADINGYLWLSGQHANDAMFSYDCTHLAGVWDGIEGAVAGDDVGLGYQALLGTFVAAYQAN